MKALLFAFFSGEIEGVLQDAGQCLQELDGENHAQYFHGGLFI